MPRSLISLGANLGRTHETMLAASEMLSDCFGRLRVRVSRLYQTPPVGGPTGQSDFLNAVAVIDSEKTCWEVWEAIKRIERDLGRQRMHRWEARRIDIDLLIHGQERIWTPHLKIPHPRMCMRTFVLTPANEIAPELIDPVTGWSIAQLHAHIGSNQRRSTTVLSNADDLVDDLNAMFRKECQHGNPVPIEIHPCMEPAEIQHAPFSHDTQLVIACVSTPDSESIHWEDFTRSWADALGLTPTASTSAVSGPRYLLPANDRNWARHEIFAAIEAMQCPVHVAD